MSATIDQIKHHLPDYYWKLFPESVLAFSISEKKATCDDCAMQPGRTRSKVKYDKDLKCCTYEPYLPNFTVGAILESKAKAGADATVIRRKIETRGYALPIGMVPDIPFQVEFNNREAHEFGNRADWLCPYYSKSNNNCSIWRYRGSVCTSYYCKSDFGKTGLKYWDHLRNYMSYVEMALMEDCLAYLDFSPRQVSDLLGYLNRQDATKTELKQRSLPEMLARQLWNGYFDNQEDFYLKCAKHVQNMSKEAFTELLGETGQGLHWELMQTQFKIEELRT